MIKNLFFKHMGLKIISLIIAILLWFLVVGEKKSEIAFMVPIEINGIPTEMEIVNEIPQYADVRITGSRTIKGISPREIRVYANLTGDKKEEDVHLSPIIPKDRNIKRVDINPDKIRIKLEQTDYKKVAVNTETEGVPAKGFLLKNYQITPKKIDIAGPKSKIKIIKSIRTTPIKLNGHNKSFSIEVKPILENPTRLAKNIPIIAEVNIEEKITTSNLINIPVVLSNPQKNIKLLQDKIDILVEGPINDIEKLKNQKIKATIENNNLQPGIYWLPAKIELLPKIFLISAKPKKFKIVVK